jgi:hypothetical protein
MNERSRRCRIPPRQKTIAALRNRESHAPRLVRYWLRGSYEPDFASGPKIARGGEAGRPGKVGAHTGGRGELVAKYSVTQSAVSQLLADVHADKIAIPELQRPFVWDSVKVRDLMDSLYKGYPVGYLITWQSIGAKLKGGQIAAHQQILIDGQQRITALRAAVAGLKVIDKRYKAVRIVIAFNPVTEEFATLTPVIAKNPEWISDLSEFFNSGSPLSFARDYLERNADVDSRLFETNLARLEGIKNAQIGIIALADDLEVETVAEIFIRINSKGVPLSSADFAMSKIATYGDRGRNLRKLIDYFCHLAVAPHAYSDIKENDTEFAETPFLKAIAWLQHDAEDLYDPAYGDVIRVAGLVGLTAVRRRASSANSRAETPRLARSMRSGSQSRMTSSRRRFSRSSASITSATS